MARQAREKSQEAAFYHIYNRVAGSLDWMPFQDVQAQQQLMRLILFHLGGCFCQLASFVIMGNHFHLVVWMDKFRELTREELRQRARYFYGKDWERYTRLWDDRKWERFNQRLFDISRIMQVLQSQYARWYNQTYNRRGRFWGDRFQSNLALDLSLAQEFVLYNELNPVRARLADTPEGWGYSSAQSRYTGEDQYLMALHRLFPEGEGQTAFEYYRYRLLYRGSQPGSKSYARIPQWVIEQEEARGFKRPGEYLKRQRCFNNGAVTGSFSQVKQLVDRLREQGSYKRRVNPIPQLDGVFYTLRPQRKRHRE